jgi:hypothetical protein
MKKLPIGISDFKELIQGDYIYVDKTQYIYKLIKQGKYYFLSRPRRFGKSLLLSTIEYLFKGERELYRGLYIYSYNIGNKSLVIEDKWNWEETYPVIRIEFAETQVRNEEELEKELKATIIETGKKYGYEYNKEYTINRNLRLLIEGIYEESKKQVVILIDEYDKPILDNIENKKEVEKIRETLKGFYTTLKGLDKYIRFVLITGVSKFSKVSLFSGLNQLKDISLDPRYGNICGYTQEELENYFKDYLEGLDKEEIKEWYNGYNFLQEKLYNPFDILLYLDTKKFKNYWYETGKTEFLFKLLKNKDYQLPFLTKAYYTNDILDKFDIEYISIEALMFQTGYLTIKEIEKVDEEEVYILNYPNKEVRQSFNRELLRYITGEYKENNITKLKLAIINEDIQEIKNQIEIFLESISYEILRNEYVYQAAIYGLVYSIGYSIVIEDSTSKGRIDLTILVNRSIVYIIEFKVLEDEKEKGKALKQILEKEYYKKYLNYEKIYLIGIELDKTKKQISNFEYKQVK